MKRAIAVILAGLLAVPVAARAETSVISPADLDRALAARADRDEVSRATVRALLARPEVQEIASSHGLDLRRADAAVATLDSAELDHLAAQANQANDLLAGGQVIQISLVAALLIIIVVILLVK